MEALLIFVIRMALTLFWATLATGAVLTLTLIFWKKTFLDWVYAKAVAIPIARIMGWKIICEGQEHITAAQPCIFIGNHQSNFDLVTYGHLYPKETVCIGKKELKWVPLFGLFFVGAGNIMIDRQNRRNAVNGLNQAREAMLQKSLSIWIFPEGTRNHGQTELLPFKRGAFHMAIAAQRPVVAFVHQPLKTYFDAQRRVIKKAAIHIKVLPPFETKGLGPQDVTALMLKVKSEMELALKQLAEPH